MKKLKLISLLAASLFTQTIFAQNKDVKVFITDEHIDSSELEKNYDVNRKIEKNNILPDKKKRDYILGDVVAETKDWDELQKDIFYMDLQKKSLSELVKKYPEIMEKRLKELKEKRK